jgi:hypothetical protein
MIGTTGIGATATTTAGAIATDLKRLMPSE